jgi:hypothetical protein
MSLRLFSRLLRAAAAAPVAAALAPPTIKDAAGGPLPARLIQVHTAFRHGARNPVSDYGCRDGLAHWHPGDTDKSGCRKARVELFRPGSADPIDPVSLFGDGEDGDLAGGGRRGGLTQRGLEQGVELGAALRERYVDDRAQQSADVRPHCLLPAEYARARRLVEVRSTCVERTVFTAAGVLGGLFPELCEPDSPSVEVDLSASDDADEYLVLNDARCPRLRQLFNQGMQLSAAQMSPAQRELVELVEGCTDWHAPAEWSLMAYRDWYACRDTAGKPIPPALTPDIGERLDHAAAEAMHHVFEGGAALISTSSWSSSSSSSSSSSAEQQVKVVDEETRRLTLKLSIGRMWSRMIDGLSRPDGALHLYSGHDWTVSPLLLCLVDRSDPLLGAWPPFTANLAIELWCTRPTSGSGSAATAPLDDSFCHGGSAELADEGRYVRCVYNGQPIRMRGMPEGADTCTLAEFKTLVAPFVVEDFGAECAMSASEAAVASEEENTFGFNR